MNECCLTSSPTMVLSVKTGITNYLSATASLLLYALSTKTLCGTFAFRCGLRGEKGVGYILFLNMVLIRPRQTT